MRISDWSSDVCSSDLTNDTSPNFRLATARIEAPGEWAELIPASPDFYMTDISNFKNFYVVEGRHSGLDQIEIRDYATNTPKRIDFPEDCYKIGHASCRERGCQYV